MKVHESEDSRGELGHIAGMTDDYLRGGRGIVRQSKFAMVNVSLVKILKEHVQAPINTKETEQQLFQVPVPLVLAT